MKLEKNLGPTRDAISSVLSTGSSSFFKAVEGVRSEVSSRLAAPRSNSIPSSPTTSTSSALPSSSPSAPAATGRGPFERRGSAQTLAPPQQTGGGLRPLSLGLGLRVTSPVPTRTVSEGAAAGGVDASAPVAPSPSLAETAQAARATLGAWGAGLGSFISARATKLTTASPPGGSAASTPPTMIRTLSSSSSLAPLPNRSSELKSHGAETFSASPIGSPTFSIRDLDKEREDREKAEALAKALSEPLGPLGDHPSRTQS